MPLRVNGYLVDKIRYNGAVLTTKAQRLASCDIDTTAGTVNYTLEGDENQYGLTFVVDGDSITYTWPDGFECVVTIT